MRVACGSGGKRPDSNCLSLFKASQPLPSACAGLQWRMADQPARVDCHVITILCLLETVELEQYLSYIFITLPCYTVNFFMKR